MTDGVAYRIDCALEKIGLFRESAELRACCGKWISTSQALDAVVESLGKAKELLERQNERIDEVSTALETKKAESRQLRTWTENPQVLGNLQAVLGSGMDARQFVNHMLIALDEPKIRVCTARSRFRAIHECASMQLVPTNQHVVLIPKISRTCRICGKAGKSLQYGGLRCRCAGCKVEYDGEMECTVMVQWQGYKCLMERHPAVLDVCATLVHAHDTFAVRDGKPVHEFDAFDPKRQFAKIEDIKGGFVRIVFRDHDRPDKYHLVSARQIKKCKDCAETQNVWEKWFEQMALKTLYRDCYARRAVPMDPLITSAFNRVAALEADGQAATPGTLPDLPDSLLPPDTPPQITYSPDPDDDAGPGPKTKEEQQDDDSTVELPLPSEESQPEQEGDQVTEQKSPARPLSIVDNWKSQVVDLISSAGDVRTALEHLKETEMGDGDREAITLLIGAAEKKFRGQRSNKRQ